MDQRNLTGPGPLASVLIVIAFVLSLWAAASLICGFDADFWVSAVLVVLCLGGVIRLEHGDAERRRVNAETWERRDREAAELW